MPRVQHATRSRVLRLRGGDLSGPFRSKQLWRLYTQLSRQQPMLFNVVTVGALGVAGDALMQQLEGCDKIDKERIARFAAFQMVFRAPYYTMWYRMLELAVPAYPPARAIALKTAADLLISTPFQHAVFFSAQAVMEGRSDEALTRCVETLPRSVPTSWAFWGPTQLITFGMVPQHLRVAFVNTVSVAWNAILSGFNSGSPRAALKAEQVENEIMAQEAAASSGAQR